ncbi:MAG TPA: hypothetical protein VLB81_14530 [Gaiellales bacterium]|nr:hypothetical protein [Gaiellales bacterium]
MSDTTSTTSSTTEPQAFPVATEAAARHDADRSVESPAPEQKEMPKGDRRAFVRNVTLSNGATVRLRRAIGKSLLEAHRAAGPGATEADVAFALVCRLGFINGRRITHEELEDAPLEDVQALTAALNSAEGNSSGSGPAISSDSDG